MTGLLVVASPRAQQPTFRTGVELVTVPVTVTSLDHNTYIAGLTPADFRLTEDGQRQEVSVVTRERVPVSLVMVMDSSQSMSLSNRRHLAMTAAQQMAAALQPEDEVAIVFVERTIEVKLPWTRVQAIKELNFDGWNPRGVAPLNDGIRMALTMTEDARNPRRAVVLITPGIESSSRTSVTQLVKNREQSETAIYGFGIGSFRAADQAADNPRVMRLPANPGSADLLKVDQTAPGSMKPQTSALGEIDPLEMLVGDSGGTITRLLSTPEAGMAAKNVAADLGNQYLVGYTPKKSFDGKYRKLKIEVNRRGLYVRHRGGYLAMAATTP